jgi:hypothetical protein
MAESLFLRLLPYEDKTVALAEAVVAVREGRTLNPVVHTVNPASFRQVPGSPFAYWVSERVRRLFTEFSPVQSNQRKVCFGLSTKSDLRFLRLFWEVSPVFISRIWFPFVKGGAFAPYYSDVHLLIDWESDGQRLKSFAEQRTRELFGVASWSRWINNWEYYFRPGLTWSRRTTSRLSIRALPKGCIFADKGPTVFATDGELVRLLALMNSPAFEGFVILRLGAADAAARSYEVGIIQDTPVPGLSNSHGSRLAELATVCVDLRRDLDRANEVSHVFHLPALLQVSGGTLAGKLTSWQTHVAEAKQRLAEYQREIDDIAFRLYGIEGEDRRAIEEVVGGQSSIVSEEESEADGAEEGTEAETTADTKGLVANLLSYALGCSFSRWDVRFTTGERPTPELPDPFVPLPVCSPGMLTGIDGLPSHETPAGYPLQIDWDGVLVDDPDHPDDIVSRVREALEVIWGERAETIEREACEILSVKELREYFRKPGNGGFWMDHVRRYSKSRRKAPIYWLLQSSKKNYALWLYYHRLDKDLLFKALVNYVEPKLRLEENRLEQLRTQRASVGISGREAKQLEKQLDRQETFLSELRDFHDKLRRAADLHLEPDLNDGVVLNIAPLWELVPWTEAKAYWEELLAGKYEWSSIGKQLRQKGLMRKG